MESLSEIVLYHILNDEDCAEVRRFIVRHDLVEKIRFRNIDRSEEATKDLQALIGKIVVPVLCAPQKCYSGKAEILDYLQKLLTS